MTLQTLISLNSMVFGSGVRWQRRRIHMLALVLTVSVVLSPMDRSSSGTAVAALPAMVEILMSEMVVVVWHSISITHSSL